MTRDFAKLPKWARDHIEMLQGQVQTANERSTALEASINGKTVDRMVELQPSIAQPALTFGRNARAQFKVDDQNGIEVTYFDRSNPAAGVVVRGVETIRVVLIGANCVRICADNT